MADMTATLRILEPHPGIFAYYDGRIEGRRLYSDAPNWLDDGAFSLGIASYAIVDGNEAVVYDTHMSLPHARAIRSHLESLGVTSIRVVLLPLAHRPYRRQRGLRRLRYHRAWAHRRSSCDQSRKT